MKPVEIQQIPQETRWAVTRRGPDLKTWRRKQGINRVTFAKMTRLSERTVATYEKAEQLPEKIERPVKETIRLISALVELTGDQVNLQTWLETPNPAFQNRPPLEVIISGEVDQVWEMIHQIRLGAFA